MKTEKIKRRMTKTYYITSEGIEECEVDFGIKASEGRRPVDILKGELTIVGSCGEGDIVILGTDSGEENKNEVLKKMSTDGIVRGPVLMIETDENGDPINYTNKMSEIVKEG